MLIELSALALIIFAVMAAFDSLYFHIIQLKLYKYSDTRKEHLFHTLRNFFMLSVIYFLFCENFSGLMLWIGIAAALADLIILFIDLLIETDGRKRFGGIQKWEYLLHVMANGVYFAALTLILSHKEKEQWLQDANSTFYAYPSYLSSIAYAVLTASALSLLLHIILFFIKPSK